MKFRLGRYWPVALIVIFFVVTVLLYLLPVSAGAVVGDIYYGGYDGRAFFYWSIYYPDFYLMVIPIGFVIFVVIALSRRVWKQPVQPNSIFRRVFAVISTITTLICIYTVVMLMGSYEVPLAKHLASLQVQDKTYHLGEIYFIGTYDHYVLYVCDSWGLICTVAHNQNVDPLRMNRSIQPELSANPISGTIKLVVDGKVVYSNAIESSP